MTALSKVRAALSSSAFLSLTRLGGAGAGFLAQVTMAWTLTPVQLGIFYSATSLVAVAAIFTALGYPQIAVRFVTRYQAPDRQPLLASFISRAISDSLRLSLAITALIVSVSLLYPGLDHMTRLTFAVAATALPAATLLNVTSNLAGAMRHFGLSYIPEGLAKPALFFLAVAGLWLAGWTYHASDAAGINAVLVLFITAYVYRRVQRLIPAWTLQSGRVSGIAKRWRGEAWPLIMLSLFTNFFVDVAIISATPFLSSADIAVFGFCLKLALLAGFIVQVSQQVVIPELAIARRGRDAQHVDRLLRRAIVLPAVTTAATLLLVLICGDRLLSLLGGSFKVGHGALAVLVASQLLRSIAGPSAHVITLTGSQFINASLSAGAMLALALGYWLLTPAYGLMGAAIAVFAAYALWLLSIAVTLRYLGEAQTDVVSLLLRRWSAGQVQSERELSAQV